MKRWMSRSWSAVLAGWMLSGVATVSAAQGTLATGMVSTPSTAASEAVLARPVSVSIDRMPLGRAIKAIGTSAGVTVVYRSSDVAAYPGLVTLHVTQVPLGVALERVLATTGLKVVPIAGGGVGVKRVVEAEIRTGTITGTVVDGRTKQPVRGAKVGLDGVERVTETAEDGTFRVADVAAGSHTVTVKLLGYGKAVHTVMVTDGAAATVSVALEASANTLEQVVVTGTVIPTELKAVPNAITVITAKQIDERGITHIDQLFRGDVPGLFVQNSGENPSAPLGEVTMFSRGATRLNSTDQLPPYNFNASTNPIKTYVDGVEMADPKYLSQIDPKSIERIEILTGPQASTIYGSNAINGVMQIFTKRGVGTKPQLTLNLLSGWVENNFNSARTPQHDYSAQLNAVEGRLSYNVGGAWNYMGPWTPAEQTTRTDGFGGMRAEYPTIVGRTTVDVTFRRGLTQNVQRGSPTQPVVADGATGWYTSTGTGGVQRHTNYTLSGQTLGLTLTYMPASWWSHELNLGQDVSDEEQRNTARSFLSKADTTLYIEQNRTDRRSLRYATTARIPVSALAQLTVTTGADAWQDVFARMWAQPQMLTGFIGGSNSIYRRPDHNVGGFFQTQLGLEDRLFFTYGLRAEWNPGYGSEAQPNLTPRFGVALTQDVGLITAKLRGSYGRSTRPPTPGFRSARTVTNDFGANNLIKLLPYWGNIDDQLANPDLVPEHQQGGEGGLELYFGTRGSLVVTRYNQTVDGLIEQIQVDTVPSLVPCNMFVPSCLTGPNPDGYGYWPQNQYLNIGSIRNQGWELQGSVNMGPITTKGTYSWTKSRVIGVTPKFRSLFTADNYPQYQPGATFQFLPEHTWALGITYAHAASNLGLNITGTGQVVNQRNDFYFRNLYSGIRLSQHQFNVSNPYVYVSFNAPYVLTDFTASHRFWSRLEGVLQVQNLMDHYKNDLSSDYATLGRQTKIGFRVRS